MRNRIRIAVLPTFYILKNEKLYKLKRNIIAENLKDSDRGAYRCRADFKKSPAIFHHVFLEVVGE